MDTGGDLRVESVGRVPFGGWAIIAEEIVTAINKRQIFGTVNFIKIILILFAQDTERSDLALFIGYYCTNHYKFVTKCSSAHKKTHPDL